jgi:hypothetical protein
MRCRGNLAAIVFVSECVKADRTSAVPGEIQEHECEQQSELALVMDGQ